MAPVVDSQDVDDSGTILIKEHAPLADTQPEQTWAIGERNHVTVVRLCVASQRKEDPHGIFAPDGAQIRLGRRLPIEPPHNPNSFRNAS